MYKVSPLSSAVVYLILIATFLYAWQTQQPAEDAYQSTDPKAFSQQRALDIVKTLTKEPHYAGSDSHDTVREYLLAELTQLGLTPQVQSTLALSSKRYVSTEVKNVLARIPGKNNTDDNKALLLMSHYDSALSTAKGAGDAASGVATILEGVRAFLAQGAEHNNDIIILFTDAEELGLLGAEAFVAKHPWAKDVGLVLNFEARGSGGPSYMLMESNGANRALIQAFSDTGVNYPQANSLMYSIYKMLPNDTDLTVFREQGNINGFNFAFIDDHFDYHTVQDSVERLDLDSLNHQADYLMAGLEYFANADLSKLDADADWVYFNVADIGMVSYPFSWVLPLAIVTSLVFLWIIVQGFKRSRLSFKRSMLGGLPAALSIGAALATGFFGWQLLLAIFPQFADIPQGFTYNGHWILALLILLSLSFTGLIYSLTIKKWPDIQASELFVWPILIWLVINLGIAFGLTGAGFFIIPVVTALATLWLMLKTDNSPTHSIVYGLLFIPGLIILAPQIPTFTIGLGLSTTAISNALSVLLVILLIPVLIGLKGNRISQYVLFAGVLVSFFGVLSNAEYDIDNKKPSSVNYLYASDLQRSYVFSYNKHLDEFTQPYFAGEKSSARELNDFYPVNRWRLPRHVATAEKLNLTASKMDVERQVEGDSTLLKIVIQPSAATNVIQLIADQKFTIEYMSMQGEVFSSKARDMRRGMLFRHIVTSETPLKIEFKYQATEPVNFRMVDTRFDLAQQWPDFTPRPDWIMPTPFRRTDSTIISQPLFQTMNDE